MFSIVIGEPIHFPKLPPQNQNFRKLAGVILLNSKIKIQGIIKAFQRTPNE